MLQRQIGNIQGERRERISRKAKGRIWPVAKEILPLVHNQNTKGDLTPSSHTYSDSDSDSNSAAALDYDCIVDPFFNYSDPQYRKP